VPPPHATAARPGHGAAGRRRRPGGAQKGEAASTVPPNATAWSPTMASARPGPLPAVVSALVCRNRSTWTPTTRDLPGGANGRDRSY